jgi:hypothetical protein
MDYLLELKHIQFKFVIYTPYTDLIDKYRDLLKEKIEIRKPIPRDQLLKELSKMDFLLNLENVDTPTAIPSKLIDYSISQRPILSINPNNIDKVKILEFLAKDYTKQYKVENINQYHVDSVIRKFEELF